jgi:hypothetical protein
VTGANLRLLHAREGSQLRGDPFLFTPTPRASAPRAGSNKLHRGRRLPRDHRQPAARSHDDRPLLPAPRGGAHETLGERRHAWLAVRGRSLGLNEINRPTAGQTVASHTHGKFLGRSQAVHFYLGDTCNTVRDHEDSLVIGVLMRTVGPPATRLAAPRPSLELQH